MLCVNAFPLGADFQRQRVPLVLCGQAEPGERDETVHSCTAEGCLVGVQRELEAFLPQRRVTRDLRRPNQGTMPEGTQSV